jgi:hypothetical protein
MASHPPGPIVRIVLPLAALLLCLLGFGPAHAAETGLFAADSLSAVADFRLVASEGEPSWTAGGFGKARFGGADDHDWKLRAVPAEALLIWQPRFTWSVGATVVAGYQDDQDHPVDLIESFVTIKPLPKGSTRLSARAGLYWPEISLEHQGAAWQVQDMITPSAINSWIGEEVKVIGAEATVAREIGSHQLSGTIGMFGFNDTSATLLSFRGWALHDLKATAFGLQQLPPLQGMLKRAQAKRTRPLIEIDDRPGFYGSIAWRLPIPVTLSAFHYRNRGVPEAVTDSLQWGWNTRFWNFGMRADVSDHTRILAQAMVGATEMGIERNGRYWVETRFRSAYLRMSHDIGGTTLSVRGDWFDTRERGTKMQRGNSEDGWAATAAVSNQISTTVSVIGEVLHIDSKRGTRARSGLAPQQTQTVVQAVLRLGF